jgi:hypothetical protein
MDAREKGFGMVVPMPRLLTQLGDVVYVDKEGVIRSMGNVFDDAYFEQLIEQGSHTLDCTAIEEEHPCLTVALGTGCRKIKPLASEESAAYLRTLNTANNWQKCRSRQ